MLRLLLPRATHADIFHAHHGVLLKAARRLTDGDADAAHDLVHDAFLHFVLAQPDLEAIERVDHYLFITLRNLHLSRLRRASRAREVAIPVLDYDCAKLGLIDASAHGWVEALDELRAIGAYLSTRRETSKAAAVLILRFFYGYYPTEIARVIQSPVAAVHKHLHMARADVRHALEPSGEASPRTRTPREPAASPASPADRLSALRASLFTARAWPCPERHAIRRCYRVSDPLDVVTLAHVTACRSCLTWVSRALGMPGPAERMSDDEFGPDTRGRFTGSGGSSRRGADGGPPPTHKGAQAISRERIDDVFTHRPRELRTAVNGFLLGVQRVAGADNAQTLRLGPYEPVTFVEVSSEQGIRLLLMNVESLGPGSGQQSASVALNDERRLTVTLSLRDICPVVEVSYVEPAWLAEADSASSALGVETLKNNAEKIQPQDTERAWPRASRGEATTVRAWAIGWSQRLREIVRVSRRRPRRFVVVPVALMCLALLLGSDGLGATLAAAQRWIARIATQAYEHLRDERRPAKTSERRRGDLHLPREVPRVRASAPAAVRRWSESTLLGLEIEAWHRFDRVGALMGESVDVARVPSNGETRVVVSALVDTAARKGELLEAVAPLRAHPAVQVSIKTAAEVAAARSSRHSTRTEPTFSVRQFVIPARESPLAARLRQHFAAAGLRDQNVESSVSTFQTAIVEQASRARAHAWALERLVGRYAPETLRAQNAAADKTWRAMIREHAAALAGEVSAIRAALAPLVHPDAPSPSAEADAAIEPATGLAQTSSAREVSAAFLVGRLVELTTAQEEAIRFACTASVSPADEATRGGRIQTHEFRQSLSRTEALGRQLQAMP